MTDELTVLMCVFNEKTSELEKSIQSVLHQSYKCFEFLIIYDNPNNLDLLRFLKNYEKKDERIRLVINDHNMGLAQSLNKGLRISSGKYIARMDADDISSVNRFLIQKEMLDYDDSISVVAGNYVFIDENDNFFKWNYNYKNINGNINQIMKYGNIIAHPCVMYRKEDILNLGGYRDILATEDLDLWLRLLQSGYNFKVINKILLKYRIRQSSISNKNSFVQRFTAKYIRNCYKKGFIPSESDIQNYVLKCQNSYSEDAFNKALGYYNRSWAMLHAKKYIQFCILLLKSFLLSKETLYIFYESMIFQNYLNTSKR